jgi:RNA polymerase sigma-70 factor (ECF subfamily)
MTAIDMWPRSLAWHGPDVGPSRGEQLPAPRRHARIRRPMRGVSEADWTDDGLGRRLAAGDTEALREVYGRYGGPMFTAALHHLGGDRRLAEEAVQAAMLKVWRAASTFDPTRRLAPWLYAIVRRSAIDLRRHEERHKGASGDDVVGELESGDKDAYESATTAWAVRAALERLPADQHSVMRLMYFEDLTQREIAARLGVPLGTVKTRAARAHDRLRRVLHFHIGPAIDASTIDALTTGRRQNVSVPLAEIVSTSMIGACSSENKCGPDRAAGGRHLSPTP